MKPFKSFACIFACAVVLLTACTGTNTGPTAIPGETTPGQGAAAPNATGENSQPQQQPGSAIGANATPTTGSSTGGVGTDTAGTEPASTDNTATEGAATGTADAVGSAAACNLLTPEEIQSVINVVVNAGQVENDPNTGLTTCQYTGQDDPTSTRVDVGLFESEEQIASIQGSLDQGTAVPELGDEASLLTNGVYVRVGERWLMVGVAVGSNDEVNPADAAVELARLAVAKLSQR